MYRHGLAYTEDLLDTILEEFTVHPEAGLLIRKGRPLLPKAPNYHVHMTSVEHGSRLYSAKVVAWVLHHHKWPQHNVSFLGNPGDYRKENLIKTKRKPA